MSQTVLESLNQAFHRMMQADERVHLLGEDLLDPYGGAFKVSRGLSTAFEDRVWTTPISEAGFVGVAIGMAMGGLLPVVEIMFGDFVLLAADQLINHGAKYPWMYNEKIEVPLVVRLPMGGRRGYGPTHSQTLEKHFLGAPGLAIVAANPFVDPGRLLELATLHDRRPVLFVENKKMYAQRLRLIEGGRCGGMAARTTGGAYPTVSLSFGGFELADVTLVAYGGMAELAVEAAERLLIEDERYCEVVIPSSIQPLEMDAIAQSVARSGRLVVSEEAPGAGGVGAEIISALPAAAFAALQAQPRRVCALNLPIANSPALETATLPGVDDLLEAMRQVLPPSKSTSAAG
ncbi:alpha-ketoacid dehydrogenase subunit beta [Lujinxingia litoralis]|uniref:Alpha-ketoacid dehydrogenase subunit beta n=1 Tax=Lujinxingia litoralis TaxID=2211119 RepID=A0A328C420_9DELT|nr:transketolase C-terminal domain-containing protein [Lujinxingia litoralis]RAL20487.1 alpha-ketoacid dehydrogenase subunit beta [Lujinxingia litoralis]